MSGFTHLPVLLAETIELLAVRPDGIYVDCTIGGGGHSLEVARRLEPGGLLVGIDQDPEALAAAKSRLGGLSAGALFLRGNFRELDRLLAAEGITRVDGFLFDLGVSSPQLDEAERGFSYQTDAELDMRMDPDREISALELVNQASPARLAEIIADYGEERWAKRIADFIVRERQNRPICSTGQLVRIIKAAVPAGARRDGPHPAKRTFQALRIFVNDELAALREGLEKAIALLDCGGRVCAISFHSLEDRIVKQTFHQYLGACRCPPGLPVCTCGARTVLKLLTRKPVVPDGSEIKLNPRARSAKLRAAEKIDCSKE